MAIKRKGVDISTWNGDVNFKELKAAGVEFVIIRCGFGSDYKDQDDERFEQNVKKADEAGMPYGIYLYSYANTLSKAESEAAHVLRLLKGKNPLYGVWFDAEDKIMPANKELLTDICVKFCDTVEKAGYYVGIYATLSWLNNRFENKRIERFDKWVAQWNTTCDYKGAYGLWQFTDSLKIGGKNFDGNYAFKDYPKIIKGMNGTKEKTIEELAQEVLKGLHGDDDVRRKSLGAKFEAVQKRVNEIKAQEKKAQEIKAGDKVKLSSNATIYGTSRRFDLWVYSSTFYVREIAGSRVVLSTRRDGRVTGAVNKKYLTKI